MPLMTCEVISERKNEYPGKRGFVSDRLITLVDQEPTKGARFRTAFEHRLSDDEKRKFEPDALTGKLVKFGLTNTASFQGGRLGFEGNIIEVVGAKPAVKA
jgi:hypothetical protein